MLTGNPDIGLKTTTHAAAWARLFLATTLALLPAPAHAADSAATNLTAALSSEKTAYNHALLRPEDTVMVKVYQESDLDTEVKVNSKGMVSLPLLGDVSVLGRTAEEAGKAIQELYEADYLVNPKVTLTVTQRAKRRFTVLGQVTRPGVYEFPPEEGLNLLQALAMAGGYTRMASPSKIALQRVEQGQPRVLKLDAERMAKEKDTKAVEIRPDDVISVPERIF